MGLINRSFTFAGCTECGRNIKIDVGADIKKVKCECELKVVEKSVEEAKPRRRIAKKADNDS